MLIKFSWQICPWLDHLSCWDVIRVVILPWVCFNGHHRILMHTCSWLYILWVRGCASPCAYMMLYLGNLVALVMEIWLCLCVFACLDNLIKNLQFHIFTKDHIALIVWLTHCGLMMPHGNKDLCQDRIHILTCSLISASNSLNRRCHLH